MAGTSVTEAGTGKVNVQSAQVGEAGQRYLACGSRVGMRLWEAEEPGDDKPATRRDYETVGYVIAGRAELHMDGKVIPLEAGDSWVVPKGIEHRYRILETFSAIEATSPPAQQQGRDSMKTGQVSA